MTETRRIEVHGTVQGVGFRPHVFRVATALGVRGEVRNVGGHVVITATGSPDVLADFQRTVRDDAPPHARVDGITVTTLTEDTAAGGFLVRESGFGSGPRDVPPDLVTCAACVAEVFDPGDRRYRYPFTSCAECGPRATIVDSLPYDRSRTAMRDFPMCGPCEAEYLNPADRRFHAEPVACPDCGPHLRWHDGEVRAAALAAAVEVVANGGIVAVKGIGGYQLVCDAADDAAVLRLRTAKQRPTKPFAVMARTLADVAGLSSATPADERVLRSAAAPIVLLPRLPDAPLSEAVAPGLPEIGVFLPTSPLHHLLLADLGRPLVVTSGNIGGEPIVTDDRRALSTLGRVVDGVLSHDRAISERQDDSVVRAGRLVRRARGYAPGALPLPVAAPLPVLALGAQLKHTTALAVDGRAVLGPHTGDLENADTYASFERTAEALCRWYDVEPRFCAHDPHPGYLSTRHAGRHWPRERRIPVQHHHAHVAATAAEHGVRGRFLGVAYDGLGFGDDGTLWGGEVLLATYRGFRRMARFGRAPLAGGAAAVRSPARMALGYLLGAEDFGAPVPPVDLLPDQGDREIVGRMIARGLNSPRASSAGRLFDAAAAALGLCRENTYEGEAAVLLEAAATGRPDGEPLAWALHRRDDLWVYDPVPTLADLLTAGGPPEDLAARFHTTIAEVTTALVEKVADATGVHAVCLGGGVFQNRRLTDAVVRDLDALGYEVYVGERVPVNDGGIAYGQAAVAAARLAGR